jgi:hypothetical protein
MSDEEKTTAYEATLRRQEMHWQSSVDFVRHNDRAAIDIGIAALKTAALINAGASVALLAFVGQLWNKGAGHVIVSHILHSGVPFVWGLLSASGSFAVAYFYQSALTALAHHEVKTISAQNDQPVSPRCGMKRFAQITGVIMIGLAFAALGNFVWGAFSVMRVFENSI